MILNRPATRILHLFLIVQSITSVTSLSNWANNYQYSTDTVVTPLTHQELLHALQAKPQGPIKPLGTRHSFSAVADTFKTGTLLRLTELNNVIHLDTAGVPSSVTVQPGITYAALGKYLHEQGYALANYASLPHISIGGAFMTSTHGSGLSNQILAGSVLKYQFLALDESISTVTLTPDDPDFYTALVSVGSVGILTSVTLQIEPQYYIQQCIYPDISWDILLEETATPFFQRAYSVSGFTDWKRNTDGTHDLLSSVWLKHKIQSEDTKEKTTAACPTLYNVNARSYHPLPLQDSSTCSPNGIGHSHTMLPHFLPQNAPSGGGEELQTEYFIALEHAVDALHALRGIAEQLAPYVQVSEFRVVAPDLFPLSVCYKKKQSCFGMHFTWINDVEGVTTNMLPLVEQTLLLWEPRPHHGKLHTLPVEVWRRRYPGFRQVRKTAHKFDPTGRLQNEFLMKYVYDEQQKKKSTAAALPTAVGVGAVGGLADPTNKLHQIISDFNAAAAEFDGMDAMDQLLMDQVDELLEEDIEDLSVLTTLEEQMEHMLESTAMYGDFGEEGGEL